MAAELAVPKRGGNLLGSPRKQQTMPDLSGIHHQINSLTTRLRLVEEGFTNLRRMSQITEENLVENNKHYQTEFKTLTSEISETKKEIQELKETVLLLISEIKTTAKKEDIKVLQKYVNFWNPIRFVTHDEVENIINEVIDRRSQKKTQHDGE